MAPDRLPHPIPAPRIDLIAAQLRVLGEPMRIRLLDRLRGGEATVAQLTEGVGSSQQNVSKHLGVLHQAGILRRRREGTYVLYSIADRSVLQGGGARARAQAAARAHGAAAGARPRPHRSPAGRGGRACRDAGCP